MSNTIKRADIEHMWQLVQDCPRPRFVEVPPERFAAYQRMLNELESPGEIESLLAEARREQCRQPR